MCSTTPPYLRRGRTNRHPPTLSTSGLAENVARYLDALLADDDGRPWAVELKDQAAGGGHGAYLRAGIGQAVLYRHYIRSVKVLTSWCEALRLNRVQCEAALAFPTMKPGAANAVADHLEIARMCAVSIVQFQRPGNGS